MDDLKDKRGYCQFKEEALDRTMWRNRFGRGSEPVVWQITDDDDDDDICEQAYRYYVLFFFCGAVAQREPGPPYSRGV